MGARFRCSLKLAGVGQQLGRCLCELRYRCFHLTGVQCVDLRCLDHQIVLAFWPEHQRAGLVALRDGPQDLAALGKSVGVRRPVGVEMEGDAGSVGVVHHGLRYCLFWKVILPDSGEDEQAGSPQLVFLGWAGRSIFCPASLGQSRTLELCFECSFTRKSCLVHHYCG